MIETKVKNILLDKKIIGLLGGKLISSNNYFSWIFPEKYKHYNQSCFKPLPYKKIEFLFDIKSELESRSNIKIRFQGNVIILKYLEEEKQTDTIFEFTNSFDSFQRTFESCIQYYIQKYHK